MSNWTEQDLDAVFNKGTVSHGNDSSVWRMDACGAWINRHQHGNRNSIYGWEVDHINPNGGNYLANLQPLHWANNVAKSDGVLACAVKASGDKNVSIVQR